MIIFDAHCDTIQKITDFGGGLDENSFHLDLKRIKSLGCGYIQMFAAFIDKKNDDLSPYNRCIQLIEKYFEEIDCNRKIISHCCAYEDVISTINSNKIASFLSIEGGEALEGNIENLHSFYDMGVRALTLTWNYPNEICDGIGVENGIGLTDFGKLVVSQMNELGMLIDVSHISKKGFWDVICHSKYPIAATHSNAKAICPHKRNLDDEQIRAIIDIGGCIGINLYSEFLSSKNCAVKNILSHIEHILALGGENNIGLGSDFDGMNLLPDEICGVQDIYILFDEMQRLGYTDSLINNFSSGNFLNLMKKIFI